VDVSQPFTLLVVEKDSCTPHHVTLRRHPETHP
jgi:hypothetical protein